MDEWLMGDLFRANETFLLDAGQRAQTMTLLLAELHAGLLVLQSSQFGISFIVDANIQLGNIISQLTEMVAYGRNFTLFNLVALHIIENLLTLVQWMTPWLVIMAEVGLMAIISANLWLSASNRWYMSLIRFGETILIAVSLLVIIFPLAVHGVSRASSAVTETLFHNSYQAVSDTRQHILGSDDSASIKEDASSSLEKFKSIKVNLSEKSGYLSTHLTRYVAVTLLEVFILPLMFSLFLLWLFQALVRRHRHWNR
ncbi:hypothetical protein [Endozoicomonas atrinae]|uniref:hypothetical protein n=1 Tax=Endozoicomonas atrinae TaxID=1333660 RepID=UPI003AFF8DB0